MSQKKQTADLNVHLAEQAHQIEALKGELRGAHEKLDFFFTDSLMKS